MTCCDTGRRRINRLRDNRLLSGAVLAGVVFSLAISIAAGCGGRPPEVLRPQGVYFDTATKRVVLAPLAFDFPAVHPATGKATLMPAMHCGKCDAWHPVPTPDQIVMQGSPLVCPKCKGALRPDGPFPADPIAGSPPPQGAGAAAK
jgi:hypothetical protein